MTTDCTDQPRSLMKRMHRAPTWLRRTVFALIGSGFILLSVLPMNWWLFTPYLFILATLQYCFCFREVRMERAMFFERWLAADSSLQRWKKIGTIGRVGVALVVLMLSLITSVALFTYGWKASLCILAGVGLGVLIARLSTGWIIRHANEVYQPLLRHRWNTRITVLIAALVMVGWEWASTGEDHSGLTASLAADRVISETKHPIRPVQHFARTIHYANLSLLRMRDSMDPPWSHFIYLYLILPNLIPILGVVSVLHGALPFATRFPCFRPREPDMPQRQ
jgi:hypothetical protein